MIPAIMDINIAFYQNLLPKIYHDSNSDVTHLAENASTLFLLDCFHLMTNDVTAHPFLQDAVLLTQCQMVAALAHYLPVPPDLEELLDAQVHKEIRAWYELMTWTPKKTIAMDKVRDSTVLLQASDCIMKWVAALTAPGQLSGDEWSQLVRSSQPGILRAFSVAAMSGDVVSLPDVAVAPIARYLYRMDATRQRSLVTWSGMVMESHKPASGLANDVPLLEDPLVTACLSLLDVFLESYEADNGPTESQQALLNSALDALEVAVYSRNS